MAKLHIFSEFNNSDYYLHYFPTFNSLCNIIRRLGEQEEGIILILYDQIQDSIKVLGNEMQPSVGGKSVEIFRLLDYDMRVTRPPRSSLVVVYQNGEFYNLRNLQFFFATK